MMPAAPLARRKVDLTCAWWPRRCLRLWSSTSPACERPTTASPPP